MLAALFPYLWLAGGALALLSIAHSARRLLSVSRQLRDDVRALSKD